MPHNGKEVRQRIYEQYGEHNVKEGPENSAALMALTAGGAIVFPTVAAEVVEDRLRQYGAWGAEVAAWALSRGPGQLIIDTRQITFWERPFGKKWITDRKWLVFAAHRC